MTMRTNQTGPNIIHDIKSVGGLPGLAEDFSAWFSVHSVEIVTGCIIGAVIVFLMLGIRAFGVRMCKREDRTGWYAIFGRAIAKTRTIFMLMVAAKLIVRYANAPDFIGSLIFFLFTVVAAFQAAIWVREIALGMIERKAGTDGYHAEALGNAMGIIRLLITFTVFTIATIVVLDNLNVNVTGLVAGLGVGGIAIGMAAKGIFDDLFAALSILFDKPFRRGDAVRWDKTSGTVEAIGLKTTRVRALTGEQIIISNANLLNKELHNMARLRRRRHMLTIGVTYQTAPETCAAIPALIREIVESQKKCALVRCGMTGFGASSLDFEIQFDVNSEDYEQVFAARNAVCLAILDRFNREGIDFAYPTQTSFTAGPDGKLVLPYPPEHNDTDKN